MNRPDVVAGDVHTFKAEPPQPGWRWRGTVMSFMMLMAALCLVLWLVRQKLRDIVLDKTSHHLEAQEPHSANPGRTFDVWPVVKAADAGKFPAAPSVTAESLPASNPSSLPVGLNEPAAPINVAQFGPGNAIAPRTPVPALAFPIGEDHGGTPDTGSSSADPQSTADEISGSLEIPPYDAPSQKTAGGRVVVPPVLMQSGSGRGMQQTLMTGSFAPSDASRLAPRDLLLARGAYIPCVLETQLISNIAGFVSCIVTDNVYSDDGHTLLIERGSHVAGEYRSDARHGDTRLFVLWDRIKTPHGVVVDVASPGGDAVGGQGLPGYVDNHWLERIGAAFLLSTFQDAVAIAIAKQSAASAATTTVTTLPTNTTGAAQDLSKAVLDSTINIPPTIYKNRGEVLTIYVARDLRFDQVYAIR